MEQANYTLPNLDISDIHRMIAEREIQLEQLKVALQHAYKELESLRSPKTPEGKPTLEVVSKK